MGPLTLPEHVDGNVVVVDALGVRVDTGEPAEVHTALRVRLVNTSTFAAVTTIIVCRGHQKAGQRRTLGYAEKWRRTNVVDRRAAQ